MLEPVPGYCYWVRLSVKFNLQLLPQCGSTSSCLSRSVPETDIGVGTLALNFLVSVVTILDSKTNSCKD